MKKFICSLLVLLSVALYSQTDSRYDAGMNLPFNQKAGEVNPQTGNVTISQSDVSLPGRAGHNFSFSRVWNLNSSGVFNMDINPLTGNNRLSSNTPDKHHRLGAGWSSSIPYIHRDINGSREVVHLFLGGSAFQIDMGNVSNNNPVKSNILAYELLDKRVYGGAWGAEISYEDFQDTLPLRSSDALTERSRYVLILKDNSRYYFREDGGLMMHQDSSGLNRIWYFYDNNDVLTSVIDSVGREILFNYDTAGNLKEIVWQVDIWQKDSAGVRSLVTEERKVQYLYERGESYPEILSLKDQVTDYKEPYVLTGTINPLGNKTLFTYTTGKAAFSFNDRYHQDNVWLMVTGVKQNVYTEGEEDKYSAARFYEYEIPTKGMYKKYFYTGYMEFFKVSRNYLHNRHKQVKNDITYTYFENGENGNFNQYSTLMQQGGVSTTYYYSLKDAPNLYQVLDKVETESRDGFNELKNSVYDNNKTKILEETFRYGELKYSEKYQYDDKGNLVRMTDRQGLVTYKVYDPVYSIPVKENRIFTYNGVENNYQKEWIINGKGQVLKSVFYRKEDKKQRPVTEQEMTYDAYGNVISVTDAAGNTTYTLYDEETQSFPLLSWSEVTLDGYTSGSIADNWQNTPDLKTLVKTFTRGVYNSDGSLYLEMDALGSGTEHFYDALGRKTEMVLPMDDDVISWYELLTEVDIDLTKNSGFSDFLFSRVDNPGTRTIIDDQKAYIETIADLDITEKRVVKTAVQSDGLENPEEEYSFNDQGIWGVTRKTYDSLNRMISITDPDAGEDFTEIILHGEKVKKYDSTWIIKYDDLGRQSKVLYPVAGDSPRDIKYITYDDRINSVVTIDPEGRRRVAFSDWAGNLTEAVSYGFSDNSEPRKYLYEYDALNRKRVFIDAKGEKTLYDYDERDLLISQTFGDLGSEIMVYDDRGLIVEKTDRKENRIVTINDEAGRPVIIERYYPDGITDETVSFSYDKKGQPWRVEGKELTEYSAYDIKGGLIIQSRYLKESLLRNRINAVLPQQQESYTFSYEYTDSGLLEKMTYPDGGIHSFDYRDGSGYLDVISQGTEAEGTAPYVSDFIYNRSGVVSSMKWENGVVQSWDFDNRKRINRLTISRDDKILEDLVYRLNSVGDIKSINSNEYTYNGFGEIIGAKTKVPGKVYKGAMINKSFGSYQTDDDFIINMPFNLEVDMNSDGRINGHDDHLAILADKEGIFDEESFSYDKAGNRLTLNQNEEEYTYEYGIRNQLKAIFKAGNKYAEYAYDKNGNTIKKSVYTDKGIDITEYKYDTLNRLIETSNKEGICTYAYDNSGNRFVKAIGSEATVYLRQGAIAVAMDIELKNDGSSNVNRYVLSGDLIAGRISTEKKSGGTTVEKSYYHLDHLNSTKVVTNASAEVVVQYEYRAFGEQLKRLDESGSETGDHGKYSYGGKEHDEENGLYYFNARYYDATTGRFINVDPAQDGNNWYIYCNNNPLNMVDPTGLVANWVIGGIIGLASGIVGETIANFENTGNPVQDTLKAVSNVFYKDGEVNWNSIGKVAASTGVGIATSGVSALTTAKTGSALAKIAINSAIGGTGSATNTAINNAIDGRGTSGQELAESFATGFVTSAAVSTASTIITSAGTTTCYDYTTDFTGVTTRSASNPSVRTITNPTSASVGAGVSNYAPPAIGAVTQLMDKQNEPDAITGAAPMVKED